MPTDERRLKKKKKQPSMCRLLFCCLCRPAVVQRHGAKFQPRDEIANHP